MHRVVEEDNEQGVIFIDEESFHSFHLSRPI